jgi:long-chain acyl-CoA synthetase
MTVGQEGAFGGRHFTSEVIPLCRSTYPVNLELPMTPLDALLARAECDPDATALVHAGERWSCLQLVTKSGVLAESLRRHGVQRGDRVALHMFNVPEAALALLACWRIGAIAVPLNTRYKRQEIEALIRRVQPALYLGQAELYEAVADIDIKVLPLRVRFVVGLTGGQDGAQSWATLTKGVTADAASSAITPADHDEPAVLLATSGTTGLSKLVVWTPRMLKSLMASGERRGIGVDDVYLLSTPMMHSSGTTAFSTCLLTGAVMVLLPRFEADAALDAIAEQRCTSVFLLPFAYAQLVACQRARPRNISSLRLCRTGGDVCSQETEQAFEATFGLPLLSMWASTEEPTATVPAAEPGPLTGLLPDAEVRLVDGDGRLVPSGQTGAMLIRSPGTTPGYWLGPERIDPLPESWFPSGDLMRWEPDEQLRYMGRLKDLIVRGGSNISPVEVEDVLRRQPGIADAAVVGLADPTFGQRVGAALVLVPGALVSVKDDALAAVRRELADYKVPETVIVLDVIPRNALTKIDRTAVATRIVSG